MHMHMHMHTTRYAHANSLSHKLCPDKIRIIGLFRVIAGPHLRGLKLAFTHTNPPFLLHSCVSFCLCSFLVFLQIEIINKINTPLVRKHTRAHTKNRTTGEEEIERLQDNVHLRQHKLEVKCHVSKILLSTCHTQIKTHNTKNRIRQIAQCSLQEGNNRAEGEAHTNKHIHTEAPTTTDEERGKESERGGGVGDELHVMSEGSEHGGERHVSQLGGAEVLPLDLALVGWKLAGNEVPSHKHSRSRALTSLVPSSILTHSRIQFFFSIV